MQGARCPSSVWSIVWRSVSVWSCSRTGWAFRLMSWSAFAPASGWGGQNARATTRGGSSRSLAAGAGAGRERARRSSPAFPRGCAVGACAGAGGAGARGETWKPHASGRLLVLLRVTEDVRRVRPPASRPRGARGRRAAGWWPAPEGRRGRTRASRGVARRRGASGGDGGRGGRLRRGRRGASGGDARDEGRTPLWAGWPGG